MRHLLTDNPATPVLKLITMALNDLTHEGTVRILYYISGSPTTSEFIEQRLKSGESYRFGPLVYHSDPPNHQQFVDVPAIIDNYRERTAQRQQLMCEGLMSIARPPRFFYVMERIDSLKDQERIARIMMHRAGTKMGRVKEEMLMTLKNMLKRVDLDYDTRVSVVMIWDEEGRYVQVLSKGNKVSYDLHLPSERIPGEGW